VVLHGSYPLGNGRAPKLVSAALKQGFEVDVVAMRRPGEPRKESLGGARILRLPLSHRRGRGMMAMLLEYVGFAALASLSVGTLALRRRYAIIEVQSPPDFLVLAAAVPKLLGARVVLDVQDFSADMFEMRFGRRRGAEAAQRLIRSIERYAGGFADAVLTVHQPYREELAANGVPLEKTVVVMNALNEGLLRPARDKANANLFRVMYHGTVTPHEIYGEGDAFPAVRTQTERAGLVDRVALVDRYLPQQEVLERARMASVGVVPNLPVRLNRFALPTKMFEYVALGVPVVAADLPTIRAHFSANEISFFRPGDPGSLAAALLDVARDPTAAASRAAAARRRYERYRWYLQANAYAGLLGDLVGYGRLEPSGH
jgi:hypothetical protein